MNAQVRRLVQTVNVLLCEITNHEDKAATIHFHRSAEEKKGGAK